MSVINTPQLHKLWKDAQDRPEWAPTKFWEYVFKQKAFSGHQWIVASQQPPTYDEEELRRVDLLVERVDDKADTTTLLFMKATRAQATVSDIETVEYQVFTACCANLLATKRKGIWAMTCVGTTARLWAYKLKADYLTPFFPLGLGLPKRAEYVEYATSGDEILDVLNYIKDNPVPPSTVFQNPPSPRPASPSLPPNWHDDEVALMASTLSHGTMELDPMS